MDSDIRKKTLQGKVVSNKMRQTLVVAVERYFKHPKYGKYLKRTKRYQVHNIVDSPVEVGTQVKIQSCRPVSKHKHFTLIE